MNSPFRILIVDDHIAWAAGFAQVLDRAGYLARTAASAEEGLGLAESERPAAILVDLRMPFINGAGFRYRMRAIPALQNTPVMVVTGAIVTPDVEAELRQLGAILQYKPLGVAELLTEVAALLHGIRHSGPTHGLPQERLDAALDGCPARARNPASRSTQRGTALLPMSPIWRSASAAL